jgi:hypothetical protein
MYIDRAGNTCIGYLSVVYLLDSQNAFERVTALLNSIHWSI